MWWLIIYLVGVVCAFLIVNDYNKFNPNAFGKHKILYTLGLSLFSWVIIVSFLAIFYYIYTQGKDTNDTI